MEMCEIFEDYFDKIYTDDDIVCTSINIFEDDINDACLIEYYVKMDDGSKKYACMVVKFTGLTCEEVPVIGTKRLFVDEAEYRETRDKVKMVIESFVAGGGWKY